MTDWKSSLRADPTEFLLANGSPPVVYRFLSEVLGVPETDPRLLKARESLLVYKPAVKLARLQRKDGTWGGAISMGGAPKPYVSTEYCLTMLFEYGWDKGSPQVRKAAKVLKTFLSEKRDLNLYEYQSQVKADDLRQRYYRWFLRIVSSACCCARGTETKRRSCRRSSASSSGLGSSSTTPSRSTPPREPLRVSRSSGARR